MHYHCVIVLLHERIICLYTGSYFLHISVSGVNWQNTTAASLSNSKNLTPINLRIIKFWLLSIIIIFKGFLPIL